MKILLKYPSRGRPSKFKDTLVKHTKYLSYNNTYTFVFSFDSDDTSMNTVEIQDFIKTTLSHELISYEINYSNNQNKIEAINNNLTNKEFDILILLADDMVPVLNNYDNNIVELFKNNPLLLDNTIHFYTSRWAHILDIWCIMGYNYYKRFNYIYHPSYKSIFCDNEYTEVSCLLNRTICSYESPFVHDWESDSTHQKNSVHERDDWLVYENRKQNNYYLDIKNKI